MSHRQIKFTIGLLYSTTVEQLRQVTENINDYIQKNDDFAKEGVTTFVKVIAFNDSSIDIQIYAFTNTTIWTEWLQIREDLITEIKTIVTDAGSDFAYPSTSLYLGEKEKNYLNK
jgi:MscS family membrane protein